MGNQNAVRNELENACDSAIKQFWIGCACWTKTVEPP